MRKQLLGLISLLCLLAFGCGQRGQVQDASQAANLILITEKSFFSAGIGLIPTLDGKETYVLDQNQYVLLHIPQGEHTITGKIATGNQQTTNESTIKISSAIGETVYLYFVLHQPSFAVFYATVTRISEDQALQFMKDATRIGVEQSLPLMQPAP